MLKVLKDKDKKSPPRPEDGYEVLPLRPGEEGDGQQQLRVQEGVVVVEGVGEEPGEGGGGGEVWWMRDQDLGQGVRVPTKGGKEM